jgi:hypothetical protein
VQEFGVVPKYAAIAPRGKPGLPSLERGNEGRRVINPRMPQPALDPREEVLGIVGDQMRLTLALAIFAALTELGNDSRCCAVDCTYPVERIGMLKAS